MNAHDSIVDAVLGALRDPLPITRGLIDEDIDEAAVTEEVAEAVSVSLVTSSPNTGVILGHPVDWASEVTLTCFARTDGRTSSGRASRTLHASAYARLMADPTLGGKAFDIREPSLVVERDGQDTRVGACIATYIIEHRTAARSLEV
jgi:hypothetical protein